MLDHGLDGRVTSKGLSSGVSTLRLRLARHSVSRMPSHAEDNDSPGEEDQALQVCKDLSALRQRLCRVDARASSPCSAATSPGRRSMSPGIVAGQPAGEPGEAAEKPRFQIIPSNLCAWLDI